ncbi:MAG: response regulator [Chloroflexota bacterium]
METSLNLPGSIRILVVDDHPSTATTLARAISQLGPNVEVISATGGKEALERVAGDSVDVLITDMMMPGMNGLELIERMQANPGGRPAHIILITAYDVPGLKETARRMKVDETIIKPVRPERICQIVGNIIRSIGPSNTHPLGEAKTQPFKILIADDVQDNVTLLSRYMQSDGYHYVTASNGRETLEKTRAEMPDLVLLDVNMPDKDGFTVLEEMRADPALMHIPVIILTAARLHPDDVQAGLNLGADDYITKPFDRRELFARIRAKLRTKAFEDAIRSRNRQLSMLPEIGQELSARLDLDDLAAVVLRRTVETLGALCGHIVLYDPRRAMQRTHHASSVKTPIVETPNLEAFLAEINESRGSLIVNDVQSEPRWPAREGDPTRSVVIAPMSGRERLLGLLALAHERPGYFEAEHQLLLQAIASQAAIAMENALLYADISRQQKQLSVVLDGVADAIITFDADGRLSLINPAGRELFTDFARADRMYAADPCDDPLTELLQQASGSEGEKNGEVLCPDGRTFAAAITPIEDGGLVVVLHDVTSFKQVERVKNEFIASVSHDLKNPIMSIYGFGNLLRQAGPLNEMQDGFVEKIQSSAKAMNELVQNMLQLAQADLNLAQKFEIVEMGLLLAEVIHEFGGQAQEREQSLRFDPLAGPVFVSGDVPKLRLLFRNLMGNVLKSAPRGGHVQVGMQVGPDTLRVQVQAENSDISPADLPFVFDRFYRARGSGETEANGLGLAMVKSIAEQHGGRVSVVSEPGHGSHFSVEMPIFAQHPSADLPLSGGN